MDRVDFYVLSSDDPAARDILACRLAEKGSQQGLKVYVRARDPEHTATLDELMWSFSGPSFLPHEIAAHDTVAANRAPVIISEGAAPASHRDMLVSLAAEVPDDAGQFSRVADLIAGSETEKQQGRQRYRYYRNSGSEPTIHNL